MADVGQFDKSNVPLRQKLIYEGYMQMKKGVNSPYPDDFEVEKNLLSARDNVTVQNQIEDKDTDAKPDLEGQGTSNEIELKKVNQQQYEEIQLD